MKLLELYGDKIIGVLSGLDRVRFRGTLRWLAHERGLQTFTGKMNLLLKDFGYWAAEKTRLLRASCEARAQELGIERIYLRSGAVDKEELARRIAAEKGIASGSICLFSVVESCLAPAVEGNRQARTLELRIRPRKCVWIYHYWIDPEVGFGHVRLQTWLPYTVNICLNGRHWLEQQLRADGQAYVKAGNCFPWVEDITKAQQHLWDQLKTDWPGLLHRLTKETCPALGEVLSPLEFEYYWSADEVEWATDVMFRSPDDLARLVPVFLRHGLLVSDSPSIMRYLGQGHPTASGKIAGRLPREIWSDYRRRFEGVRIKHWINRNSVKLYGKWLNLLRLETTSNWTRAFKVFRAPENDPGRAPSWQKLRKGVSDLHRRCLLSERCNQRYADAVSAVQVAETMKEVVADACEPVVRRGRRVRGLNPWREDDFQLLKFLAKGEWALNGFQNKDLCAYLQPDLHKLKPPARRRLSGQATRKIRMLRSHGLIRKVPRSHRYVLSARGQKFSAALIVAQSIEIKKLMEVAA